MFLSLKKGNAKIILLFFFFFKHLRGMMETSLLTRLANFKSAGLLTLKCVSSLFFLK